MRHIHLSTCPSTQNYVLEELRGTLQQNPHTIVTTSSQTHGLGRGKGGWDFLGDALASSFTLEIPPCPTLAPLGVGICVSEFFEESFAKDVGLKWPNDFVFQNLKCGGIIMNIVDSTLVVGLGLNLQGPREARPYPCSYLFDSSPDAQKIALDIYVYLMAHWPLEGATTVEKFHQRCIHLGKKVLLWDDNFSVEGTFEGIDREGAAIIDVSGVRQRFFVGHLKYR